MLQNFLKQITPIRDLFLFLLASLCIGLMYTMLFHYNKQMHYTTTRN